METESGRALGELKGCDHNSLLVVDRCVFVKYLGTNTEEGVKPDAGARGGKRLLSSLSPKDAQTFSKPAGSPNGKRSLVWGLD